MTSMTEFQKRYFEQIKEEKRKQLANNVNLIESFKSELIKRGIELKDENFDYIQKIGIVATYPNIVDYLCGNILKDKEGLFDFKVLNQFFERRPFASGFLYQKNYMLIAHPNFRRGFHKDNNFAPRFIELFWAKNDSKIDSFISIDCNRVRINVDDTVYIELDTWYGASFNKKINEINDGNTKLRPPSYLDNSNISFFFANAYSLDIKWKSKVDNETLEIIKTFQAEEFKTEEVTVNIDGVIYYPVRYIHAEFIVAKEYFRHFDGAIHFYTEDEYHKRRDSDFNYNLKNLSHIKTKSEKLFKMNGNVDVETWINLTSHFLQVIH